MSIKLNRWDKVCDIKFEVDKYHYSDGLAICMNCKSEYGLEPYGVLTVNLDEFPTNGNKAFVDTNNLGDDIIDWIIENNLGELTGRIGFSGFCAYPEVEFNLEEINKHLK